MIATLESTMPNDGDIYLNPMFGDLLDDPVGFVKVGHVDGVSNKRYNL